MIHINQKAFYILVILLLLPAGCGTKTPVNDTWIDEAYYDRFYENIFVVGAAGIITTRNIFEGAIVSDLQRTGIGAVPSNAILPFTNMLQREDVFAAVDKYGIDCFLIISLIGEDRRTGILAYKSLKDANAYTYYSGLTKEAETAAGSNELFLKAALYDAASEKLVWSLTSSDTFYPYPKSLRTAARLIVRKLRQDGLI